LNDLQHSAASHARDPAATPVQRVDVNGRKWVFYRAGSGYPTVILETGLGAESDEWNPIQLSISATNLVCRYDRAGRGRSDPGPGFPRSAGQMVEELRSLLNTLRFPGPFLLVGHSFGGLMMRLYAHRYPSEVCGLLLVDAMHPDQFEVIGGALPAPTPQDTEALRSFRAFWTGGWRDPQATVERIDLLTSLREAKEIDSLGALPVHIITAATGLRNPMVSADLRPRLQSLWEDLQSQFLGLSSAATQAFAVNSGHFVQRDDPGIVIESIRTLIRRLR
jgi:pimeloyl-ACP methyl ester carboxylesterase